MPKFIEKVLNQLEKFLIKKNNFHLLGYSYDLILFIPSDNFVSETKFSLLISADKLNHLNQRDVIRELLLNFKETLTSDEYNSISRINILHSEDPFVKNLKFVINIREKIFEINNLIIGGVQIDHGYFIKSLILDKIIESNALNMQILNKDGQTMIIPAGIIRIKSNFDVIFYTGKGLREFFNSNIVSEEKLDVWHLNKERENYLIHHGYVNSVPFDNIVKIV